MGKAETVHHRPGKKKGKGATPILEGDGGLRQSITSDYDANSAVAGTNLVYATTHQFGAKKGAFGSYVQEAAIGGRRAIADESQLARAAISGSVRQVPIPWGDIPARPFLGVSDETSTQIIDAISDFIGEQWR